MVRPGKEAKFWADVTADMMSDEERHGDIYVRHAPAYRSEKFNNFLKKLDERAASKGKGHARFERQDGCTIEKTIPVNCKPWMVKKGKENKSPSGTSMPLQDDCEESSDAGLSSDTD